MMQIIIFWVLIFLEIIQWIVIIDIILSWLSIFWVNIRINFIADIIEPIYNSIKKNIPTNIWPFDFTPMIIFFVIIFLRALIIILFPEVSNTYTNISQNI